MTGLMRQVSGSFAKGFKDRNYQDATEIGNMLVGLSLGTTTDTSLEGHFGFLEKACQLSFVT